jgi:uncharacterized protein (TIGR02145 family)
MILTHGANSVSVESYPWHTSDVIINSHTYPTVRIKNKIFIRYNLDEPIGSDDRYYNNDEATYGWNGYKCGRLYTFTTVESLITSKLQEWGISEWHVPSQLECQEIYEYVKGLVGINSKYMLAKSNSFGNNFPPSPWDGIDYFDFSMLPSGQIYEGRFYNLGSRGCFWLSDRYSSSQAGIVAFEYPKYANWTANGRAGTNEGFSIRLCKNA